MKKKGMKGTLISSLIAITLSFSTLVGTTFAWFTDSEEIGGNVIQTGTLSVGLYWADGKEDPASVEWKDASEGEIFNSTLWEPGYTEARHLKVVNEGSLAFKYRLNIVPTGEVSALADVIDVYFIGGATQVESRTQIDAQYKIGTLRQMIEDPDGAGYGVLTVDDTTTDVKENVATGTIVLKMQESAGNEFQDKMIGDSFSVQVMAAQYTHESDGFDDQYDKDAKYTASVSTLNALFTAIENGDNVKLTKTITIDEAAVEYIKGRSSVTTFALGDDTEIIASNAVIDGNGITVYRTENTKDKPLFEVAENCTLTLSNITLDGGANWTGEIDSTLLRGTINSGITTSGNLVVTSSNAHLVLEEGTVLQNNDGAYAVNLGTRLGATLTLNGGWIINNRSEAGAIWGGGHIIINEGSKINYNSSTGIAGAIRMVGQCNLTMNGGEICNNVATTDGGAIWGYGINGNTSVYKLTSGKINNNMAGGVGGAIYTGTYSEIYIAGDFEICGNVASDSGAMRLTNYTKLNMSGGKISNNVSTDKPEYNGFYGWCPILTITGGELADDIYIEGGHTPIVGGSGITGVVYFDVSTNHNTVNLAKNFGTFEFMVAEGDNFEAFNLKPEEGYVYVEGDENKLKCLNEGHETYWDATTGSFRLKVSN